MARSSIILDTNIWIFGLFGGEDFTDCRKILNSLNELNVMVPRQVLLELNDNLKTLEMEQLFSLLNRYPENIEYSWKSAEPEKIKEYMSLGCKLGDATIAAHMEMENIEILVSENRTFLQKLSGTSFSLCNSARFCRDYSL